MKFLFLLNKNIEHQDRSPVILENRPVVSAKQRDIEMQIRNMNKDFFSDEDKSNDAIEMFKSIIAAHPGYPNSYDNIGQIYLYRKNYDEAVQWFMKAVWADPNFRENTGIEENEGYLHIRRMRNMYMGKDTERIRQEIDRFVDVFTKTCPMNAEHFLQLSTKSIRDWVESDIMEIVHIIRSRGIRVILQNYPDIGVDMSMREVNFVMSRIAKKLSVPFVDNSAVFRDKIVRGASTADYFVADGHCNGNGYFLMAVNVYNKIVGDKILQVEND